LVDELTASLGGARHEARFIADEVLGRAGAPSGTPVPPSSAHRARAMAERRRGGEPLQYVFGHWPFRGLDLVVDPRVLIPRPETEQVVEVALDEARRLGVPSPPGLVAVDAGTGTGAIALSLATELPGASVWATDSSADALAVAAANLASVRREHGAAMGPVELVQGSWLAALPAELAGRVHLVVSNPPYVAAGEWESLDPEVRAEPRDALIAGPGSDGTPGLADVEAVLDEARRWLARPGVVVVELAPHQAAAAADRARAMGYGEVRVRPDLAGRPRALVARAAD
jgi:release factor glutamine methyltransferase